MVADDPSSELTRRTVRKLDLILLPFLSLLFLVNSLDRSNIGNAETAHFTRDAGLEPEDLNDAVAWFFVFFVALQPVGAAFGRKFGMSIWVPSVMALWGICTLLHIWVRSRWQLITVRIILGMLEAGFYPTTVSYLSLFYTRYEFGRRLGLFYGSYGVAGALGGIIAFVVFSRFSTGDGPNGKNPEVLTNGWKPWQVLFMVEGGFTVVIALIGFFWLPKNPGTAWFLTPEEREVAEMRVYLDRESGEHQKQADSHPTDELAEDGVYASGVDEQSHWLLSNEQNDSEPRTQNTVAFTADAGLSKQDVLSTVLFLPLIIPVLVLNIASAIPSTAFSIFLPLVLSHLDLSSDLYSNLLTAPPFLLASVTLYIFTHWSDKSRKRIIPILASLCIIAIGLILTLLLSYPTPLSSGRAAVAYFVLCLLLSGCFIPSPLTVAWFAGNIPEPGKRAIVLGVNGYGNLAGVFAAYIFSPKWQPEGYRTSFLINLGVVLVSLVGFAFLRVAFGKVNRARTTVLSRWSEVDVADEHTSGTGKLENRRPPGFAILGGVWWDKQVRYWVGRRLLAMRREETQARRGDEKLTFTYGY